MQNTPQLVFVAFRHTLFRPNLQPNNCVQNAWKLHFGLQNGIQIVIHRVIVFLFAYENARQKHAVGLTIYMTTP